MRQISVAVVLFTSKTYKNGQHPLMIRVTQSGKSKYKSLGIKCHPKNWNFKKQLPKPNHPQRYQIESVIRQELERYNNQILEMRRQGKYLNPEGLIEMLNSDKTVSNLLDFTEKHYRQLWEDGQFNSSRNYKGTYLKVRKYLNPHEASMRRVTGIPKKDIAFSEVTYNWLEKFKKYLIEENLKDTTLAVHFRNLKSLYNKAIEKECADPSSYPFNKFKLSQFETTTQKRALTREEIIRIEELKIMGDEWLKLTRDLFIFSFYGGGINFKDIIYLKWKNLSNGRINYKRSKTGHTNGFALNEITQKIIEHYRPYTDKGPEQFIFPILDEAIHITEKQKFMQYSVAIKNCNLALKRIGQLADVSTTLTTYVPRHSQATIMKYSGVPVGVISQIMGHSSVEMTQIYLRDFGDDVIDDAMSVLLQRKSS